MTDTETAGAAGDTAAPATASSNGTAAADPMPSRAERFDKLMDTFGKVIITALPMWLNQREQATEVAGKPVPQLETVHVRLQALRGELLALENQLVSSIDAVPSDLEAAFSKAHEAITAVSRAVRSTGRVTPGQRLQEQLHQYVGETGSPELLRLLDWLDGAVQRKQETEAAASTSAQTTSESTTGTTPAAAAPTQEAAPEAG